MTLPAEHDDHWPETQAEARARVKPEADRPLDCVIVGGGPAGLTAANGISVDGQLLTEDPAISALGDCAAPGRMCSPTRRLTRRCVSLSAPKAARLCSASSAPASSCP